MIPLSIFWQAAVILLLVLANGFFVAAEFAMVKIRVSQLQPLLKKGAWQVSLSLHMLKHLDAYLSATQLGITFSSLALGWVGEPFIASWIEKPLHWWGLSETEIEVTGYALAFGLITVAHIVLGELAPKSLAIQMPRTVTLWCAIPLAFFYYLFFPLIWFLNGLANQLLKTIGVAPATEESSRITHEELEHVLMHSRHSHGADAPVDNLMLRALRVKRTTAAQIMIPRDKVEVLWLNKPISETMTTAQKSGYSRMPLCGKSPDDILGVIQVKELLWQERILRDKTDLQAILHETLKFSGESTLMDMLKAFQESRKHLALVHDEAKKFIGIVTLEDVVEELVGDIRDEFDSGKTLIKKRDGSSVTVDPNLPLRDLANEMGWPLPMDTEQTVEQWCLELWEKTPQNGESKTHHGFQVTIEEVLDRKLKRVRIQRMAEAEMA